MLVISCITGRLYSTNSLSCSLTVWTRRIIVLFNFLGLTLTAFCSQCLLVDLCFLSTLASCSSSLVQVIKLMCSYSMQYCWEEHTLFCWVGWGVTLPVFYVQSRHQISKHGIKVAACRRIMAQTNVVSFPQPHYHLEQHVWTLIPCSQAKPTPPWSWPLNWLCTSAWWLDWSVLTNVDTELRYI